MSASAQSKSLLELHNTAMSLADEAAHQQRLGNLARAHTLFSQALELEKQAVEILQTRFDAEPTRSVFYRSAASLALDCKDIREAERLISWGLIGNPPPEIAEELRDLLEQVNFERHLSLRGIELNPRSLQLSIKGKVTGLGVALADAFYDRFQTAQKMIYRTVERMADLPFRESGRSIEAIRSKFQLYASVPRPGSYAVTFQLGQPSDQLLLPETEQALKVRGEAVVIELLTCLRLFNSEEVSALSDQIENAAYYRNFVALAKQMAPDGEDLSLVGFTTVHGGQEEGVALQTPAKKITVPPLKPEAEVKGIPIQVVGHLKFADATRNNRIRVVVSRKETHTFEVPSGLMDDIVKPLWSERVVVTGIKRGQKNILETVQAVDS